MNQNIIDYYKRLREDEGLRAPYSDCADMDQVMDTAVREAGKLGFHFTKDEAKAAGMDLDTLRANVMNDDELNDFELELIAAGAAPKICDVGV